MACVERDEFIRGLAVAPLAAVGDGGPHDYAGGVAELAVERLVQGGGIVAFPFQNEGMFQRQVAVKADFEAGDVVRKDVDVQGVTRAT